MEILSTPSTLKICIALGKGNAKSKELAASLSSGLLSRKSLGQTSLQFSKRNKH